MTLKQADILDGRSAAKSIRAELQTRMLDIKRRYGQVPKLAILLVGNNQDSVLYANNLVRWCKRMGLECELRELPSSVDEARVVAEIDDVSDDPGVHGLIVQMPLPSHIDFGNALLALDPSKDIEGLTPQNAGLLVSGIPRYVPTTPLAGMKLLEMYDVPVSGKRAVVIGRSRVVGKPLAQLLLAADATVTVAHSRTPDLAEVVREADIVAAAAGKAGILTGDMIKPGAVVLDFGINFVGDQVVGDAVYEEVVAAASWVTPVPGGIGPLTNLMLAQNLLDAFELLQQR